MTKLNLRDQILLLSNDDQIVSVSYGWVLQCSTLTNLIEDTKSQDPTKDPLPVDQTKQALCLFFEFVEFGKMPQYSKEKLETNQEEIIRLADYLGYKTADETTECVDNILGRGLKLFITGRIEKDLDSPEKTKNTKSTESIKNTKGEKVKYPKSDEISYLLTEDNFEEIIATKKIVSSIKFGTINYYIFMSIEQNQKVINLTLEDSTIDKSIIYYKNLLTSVSSSDVTYFQSFLQNGDIGINGPNKNNTYNIEAKTTEFNVHCSRDHLTKIITLIYQVCGRFKGHLKELEEMGEKGQQVKYNRANSWQLILKK